MALNATDLKFYYSTGSSSGGSATSDGDHSLGGQIATNSIPVDQLNAVFDMVTGEESQAGDTSYRCLYVKNDGAQTAYNVILHTNADTASPDTSVQWGLDPAGLGDGVNSGVATTISDEHNAPSGVTFSAVTSDLNLGDIPAGQCRAVWFKWIVNAGASPVNKDSIETTIEFETGQ